MRNEESLGLGFGEERESSERYWGFGVENESGLSALEKREEWEVKTRLRAIFFCFKVRFLRWVLLMDLWWLCLDYFYWKYYLIFSIFDRVFAWTLRLLFFVLK